MVLGHKKFICGIRNCRKIQNYTLAKGSIVTDYKIKRETPSKCNSGKYLIIDYKYKDEECRTKIKYKRGGFHLEGE